MKKIIVTILCASLTALLYAQEKTHNKDYYLTKSKHQKTAFYVLASAGAVLLIASAASSSSHDNADQQLKKVGDGFVAVAGATLAIASIPFIIASSKNKHRAMALTVKTETVPQFNSIGYSLKAIPSLGLRIEL